jgi:hypothetical protein
MKIRDSGWVVESCLLEKKIVLRMFQVSCTDEPAIYAAAVAEEEAILHSLSQAVATKGRAGRVVEPVDFSKGR